MGIGRYQSSARVVPECPGVVLVGVVYSFCLWVTGRSGVLVTGPVWAGQPGLAPAFSVCGHEAAIKPEFIVWKNLS
jgi:hypothetical protein